MRAKLTARQQQVLDFITERIDTLGYPPTVREICTHMGTTSTNGADAHLKRLVAKGYIKRAKFGSRSITLISDSSHGWSFSGPLARVLSVTVTGDEASVTMARPGQDTLTETVKVSSSATRAELAEAIVEMAQSVLWDEAERSIRFNDEPALKPE